MLFIIKRRRIGSRIYRITYKAADTIDKLGRGNEINREELTRWLKRDSWSLREAALLSCGQNPGRANRARIVSRTRKKSTRNPDLSAHRDAANELDEILDLIIRARNVDIYGDPVRPTVFINWLKSKQPEAKLLRILAEDTRRRDMMHGTQPGESLSPNQKAAETNKLRTAHKILVALAINYTAYNDANNKSSVDKIMQSLEKCGMYPDRDTVVKHLREAYDSNLDEVKELAGSYGRKS